METNFDVITDNFREKGYSVMDNFLSEREINQVLERIHIYKTEKRFKQAGIGNAASYQQNGAIRNDFIYWIDKEDPAIDSIFFSKIDALVIELNHAFFMGIRDYEFHLAHYGPGNFYRKHRDAFRTDDARKVSAVLYLNKNWELKDGGQLKLYFENSPSITIDPTAGKLVIFESNLEHEVLESRNDRFSITGWLKNKSRLF